MKAGIIAAGWGRRLGRGPKALAEVGGRTLIDLVIQGLTDAGADAITCIVNDRSTAVCDHVRASWPALRVDWIVRTTPTSMHSFLAVLERLAEGGQESCLVSTVDSVGPPGATREFVRQARRLDADLALGVTGHIDDEKPLYAVPREVRGAPDNRPFALSRLTSEPGASPYVTAGLYWVSPAVLGEKAHALSAGFTALRQFLGRVVDSGRPSWAIPLPAIVDVDRPGDVEAAEQLICHGFVTF